MLPYVDEVFPLNGLLPKAETEAVSFLNLYPNYDGRDIIVAILDTGLISLVDPAAPGLDKTTDGKTKVVDIIDCCGSGDVVCDTVVQAFDENNERWINGKSGKKLKINRNWNNPTGEFRIGMKRGYELFPKPLITRLTKERKKKWEATQASYIHKVQEKLSNKDLSDEDKKTDLKDQLEVLKEYEKNFQDPGPIFDCVVFHDGHNWRSVVDVNEDGDLSQYTPMTDYHKEHQYSNFGSDTMLTYSVNIYDEGNVLSIVTNAGSHGTHVAAIVGANHPSNPQLNGIAPGCQIVSLKIGETRLGSMETGTGLTRALNAIVKNKCQILNMSYGEAPTIPNRGGTNEGIIGVGAYVSQSMIQADYALLERVPDMPFTWSSRPPTFDGDIGVSIYAPGGAITSVPQWTLQPNQLMNGTSMSSPNACGGITLILSALKQQNLSWSPYKIKRTIENTSKKFCDEFDRGILQICKAYNQYVADDLEEDNIFYKIQVANSEGNARGIYLRNQHIVFPHQETVSVTPIFSENTKNTAKVAYEVYLVLSCTETWVKVPTFLQLNNGGRSFAVEIDGSSLSEGFHFTEILAYNSKSKEKGPVFRIPVTGNDEFTHDYRLVIKPSNLDSTHKYVSKEECFKSGEIKRLFIRVPDATYAEISIKSKHIEKPSKFVVHLLQLINHVRYPNLEIEEYITLEHQQFYSKKFKVVSGYVLEVCLAQFWSTLGKNNIQFQIEFHGINPSVKSLDLFQGNGFKKVSFSALYPGQKFNPSLSLDTLSKWIKPSESTINALSERDRLFTGKPMFELVLEYKFQLSASNAKVYTRFPLLNDYLYDSVLDSFLLLIFSKDKKFIQCQDVYPKAMKLSQGDYVVRLQLRSDAIDLLENFQFMPMNLDTALTKEIKLEIYNNLPDLLTKGSKAKAVKMNDLSFRFISTNINEADYPEGGENGDCLRGKLTVDDENKLASTPVILSLLAKDEKKKDTKKKEEKPEDDLKAEVLKTKIEFYKKHPTEELQKALLDEYPDDIDVLKQVLVQVDNKENRIKEKAHLIAERADQLIQKINIEELVKYSGTIQESPNAQKDKEKLFLIEAYIRKIRALYISEASTVDETWEQLEKWTKPAENHLTTLILIQKHEKKGNYGSILKIINKLIEKPKKEESDLVPSQKELVQLKIKYLKEHLKWELWSTYEEKGELLTFPCCFMKF